MIVLKKAITVQTGQAINGLGMRSEVVLMIVQVAKPLTREKKSSIS